MVAVINNPEEADIIGDYIPWSISDNHASERWPLFSLSQRAAVAEFLRLQIERFEAEAKDEEKALGILKKTN